MMPLSKTNELNLIMNENAKLTVEHSGGDGWTILHGDMLNLMRSFESGVFDAVITDPPYASGGASQTAKNRTTNQKYSSMSPDKALPDFAGDQKDQRSWTNWCTEWLTEANRVCKPGAVLVVFIDWRMAPCLSDALQRADWIWRGQIVWDKQTCRPQRGRFRQQSEFALWASKGPLPVDRPVGYLPGVFRYTNPANRIHVTEKPLQLMRDVVQICVPGGRILDPFAGAGTTVLASVLEGYEAVGIEITDAYYKLGSDRVRFALGARESEAEPVE
ncbi:DNA-methyltransferase [Subdoligranulum sp. TF05-17AC]|jgi:site-specific DNA-methyltransferase (adenine-specific)|uniref:DNA-methyltransferase n=1 Tax=Ruthenibacterium lactatiformans TaxID=1550024 RepID=UPI000E751AB2|nr:site-specific DNA-methyltransferase [Subdoligranulum sp. TF05-17AC]